MMNSASAAPLSLSTPQSTPPPASSSVRDESPARPISVKQEENGASILDTLDTGYESDAPPLPVPSSETQLELELEKRRYPGASTWAPDEERLFEILFQRAERPIVPGHWEVDFRGIPVLNSVFSVGDDAGAGDKSNSSSGSNVHPIVYSRSGKDFQATMALLRLIDLTSSVRKTIQSGLRQKAGGLIKKSIDRYLSWAAEDGGYAHLRYVPNILTAELDDQLGEAEITSQMEQRMRALARLQREFLRVDRDDDLFAAAAQDGFATGLLDRFLGETADDEDEDEVAYRRNPPVVYGLFVLRSSVFLLTVDSAKGPAAYVSFHVDVHFMDRHQSVWNALTIAIAVCLARDQLARRLDDFEESPDVQNSKKDE